MYNAVHLAELATVPLDVVGPKAGATRGEPIESVRVLFEDAHSEAGIWE